MHCCFRLHRYNFCMMVCQTMCASHVIQWRNTLGVLDAYPYNLMFSLRQDSRIDLPLWLAVAKETHRIVWWCSKTEKSVERGVGRYYGWCIYEWIILIKSVQVKKIAYLAVGSEYYYYGSSSWLCMYDSCIGELEYNCTNMTVGQPPWLAVLVHVVCRQRSAFNRHQVWFQ
jgi:hypothetical protein